ncbi:MAG: hypothetical protein R6U65_01755 [Perlabentimonas sp.]
MKIEKWYRTIVESSRENPPERVWNDIQNELDIDLIWEKLDNNLHKQKRTTRIVAFSAAASILLLIAFGVAYFATNSLRETEQFVTKQVTEPASPLSNQAENDNMAQTNDSVENYTTNKTPTIAQNTDNKDLSEQEKVEVSESTTINKEKVNEGSAKFISPIRYASVTQMSVQPASFAIASLDIADALPSSKEIISGLYIGLTGQLANTWMLNNKTIQGLDKTDLTATHTTFARSTGIHVGTELSDKFDVYAEFYWVNQSKQSYSEYLHGNYVNSSIELDYYTFTAMFKYRLTTVGQNHSFLGGLYLGNMKNASQLVSGIENDVNNEYSNWDYGLLLGYGYPISISKSLVLTPGVNARVGLKNIFSGNSHIPSYLNRTQNMSINFSLSVSYSIF